MVCFGRWWMLSISLFQIQNKTRLCLNISQKKKTIITLIATTFGLNISSSRQGNQTYWRWSLGSKTSLERIVFLLSETWFYLAKVQFQKWIEAGNKGMFQPPFIKNKPWVAAKWRLIMLGFRIYWRGRLFYAYCRDRTMK
jgi:hypothetical protein